MNTATYYLIQYIPDLARREPRNIGVFAHIDDIVCLEFDPRSFPIVRRDAPFLDRRALEYLVLALEEDLRRSQIRDAEDARTFLEETFRGQLAFTGPGTTELGNAYQQDASDDFRASVLKESVARLLDRLIKPAPRARTVPLERVKDQLAAKLRSRFGPDELTANFEISNTESGALRKVDFFLNHQTDIAIDLVSLRKQASEESVLSESDKIIGKSHDILGGSTVKHYVAHLPIDARPALRDQLQFIEQRFRHLDSIIVTRSADECVSLAYDLARK